MVKIKFLLPQLSNLKKKKKIFDANCTIYYLFYYLLNHNMYGLLTQTITAKNLLLVSCETSILEQHDHFILN